MLVDAATLYYRAYYALPDSLTDAQGRPNNAVRGFFDGLRVLRDAYRPRAIVACWDDDWRPQWRVDLLPSYKTHRLVAESSDTEDVPDTLSPQVPVIAELCTSLGITVVGAPQLEADDVVAALALAADEPVAVVSGDRDLTQLVDDGARRRLLYLGTGVGKHTVYDEAAVIAQYGVRPQQYADFATLRGDPSDGIPGAPGIGAKTAAAYLAAFHDLEGVFDAAQHVRAPISKAKAATLLSVREQLLATREVVTLRARDLQWQPAVADDAAAQELAQGHGVSAAITRWLQEA